MNGALNVIRADEHNRELLRAAQLDPARADGLPRAPRRFGREWAALLWSSRSRTARAARRAAPAPIAVPAGAALGGEGAAAHPLAALATAAAAPGPAIGQLSVAPARRFAPTADEPITAADPRTGPTT